MSGTAIYSKAIQIDGRYFDIVISAPRLTGSIQDQRVIEATTELFLKTIAEANGVSRENISIQQLTNTIFQIDATGHASVKVENKEVQVNNIRDIPNEIKELTGLTGRITVSAQDTISAIRDLQYAHIVYARIESDDSDDDCERPSHPSQPVMNHEAEFRQSVIGEFSD